MELPGVVETFGDDLTLIAALQLRWHTRLAGRIERAIDDEPSDLESAVLTGWLHTAEELAGVRLVLDAYAAEPSSAQMRDALGTARRKEQVLLAAMAGRASASDAVAVQVGATLEERARARFHPVAAPRHRGRADTEHAGPLGVLVSRIKSRLAA
ncbi:MAG: hypothetical protein HOQ22_01385 [Nocardioidaceae bacterium]|nr:hypothetical protein [Nocardioidaceae bacterium]